MWVTLTTTMKTTTETWVEGEQVVGAVFAGNFAVRPHHRMATAAQLATVLAVLGTRDGQPAVALETDAAEGGAASDTVAKPEADIEEVASGGDTEVDPGSGLVADAVAVDDDVAAAAAAAVLVVVVAVGHIWELVLWPDVEMLVYSQPGQHEGAEVGNHSRPAVAAADVVNAAAELGKRAGTVADVATAIACMSQTVDQ